MIIRYASDLHLEFGMNSRYMQAYGLAEGGDILLLAGDVAFLEKRALLPYLCADGIHPSDLGQRLIHKVLSEAADALPAFI